MKWSIASQVAFGASAVHGACSGQGKLHKPLPLYRFSGFETISSKDAWAGITKAHQLMNTTIFGDLPAIGVPAAASTSGARVPAVSTTFAAGVSTATPSPAAGVVNEAAVPEDAGVVNAAAVPAATTCANPNMRFEWRNYSDSDRHAFVEAIACLIGKPASGNFAPSTNRYEDLVRVNQLNVNTIHGNNIFLPWHRYFVWTFEQILRDECGFDRAFPWWDEELDAGKFAASSIFTSSFFGSLPAATNGAGTCITDGVSCILIALPKYVN
jgi:hypothetical protein